MITADDIAEARQHIKRLKAHPSTTVRRIGEALEDILRTIDEHPGGVDAALDEIERAVLADPIGSGAVDRPVESGAQARVTPMDQPIEASIDTRQILTGYDRSIRDTRRQ